jgi:hypothetical protein
MNFPELYKKQPLFDGIEVMHLYYIDREFLRHLINPSIKYTWIHRLPILRTEWEQLDWPIFGNETVPFLSRQTAMDIIVETNKLETIYPFIEANSTVVIQMNKVPPYYLRLEQVQGKERYRLLKEIDFYFELDNGGGQEWGTLTSSNVDFWDKLNNNPSVDWNKMARPQNF